MNVCELRLGSREWASVGAKLISKGIKLQGKTEVSKGSFRNSTFFVGVKKHDEGYGNEKDSYGNKYAWGMFQEVEDVRLGRELCS